MIAAHPQYLIDSVGRPTAVQLPVAEFRELVLAAFSSGRLGLTEATALLGVTRPEFYVLAARAGVSTCTYTNESVEAELVNL